MGMETTLKKMPTTTRNAAGRRSIVLSSPMADKTRNSLAERLGRDVGGGDSVVGDGMRRELPESEFKDFLGTYDEANQKSKDSKGGGGVLAKKTSEITDEIKEEDEEQQGSDEDKDSDIASSDSGKGGRGSIFGKDSEEEEADVFPSLDEALS